jgi:iron(III) transport system permease protein
VNRWRVGIALVLLAVLGVPLAAPLGRLLADPGGWRAWTADTGRLLLLGRNTGLLVAGTLCLCLPVGVLGAVLLERTDLPLAGLLRWAVVLTLFIPLPLFTSAWQAALGPDGWVSLPLWSSSAGIWAPWSQGIGSAVWIHAVAELPWVILLVGQGLRWVERDLEEDALTAGRPWEVVYRITLPRSAAAIGAAALWVAIQTASEITVTDVMQVRTLAEEVYTQLVTPETARGEALTRAVAVSLAGVAVLALLLTGAARHWERSIPASGAATPAWGQHESRVLLRLGRLRWPAGLAAMLVCGVLVGLPLASLAWRTGQTGGSPSTWSVSVFWGYLKQAGQVEGRTIAASLLVAAGAGVICAGLGLATCWAALAAPRFRTAVLLLMAIAWTMPGPVIGLGLKDVIKQMLDRTGWPHGLARALYYGPSYLPILWVDLIRFFPCAVALLWPVVRLLPRDLRDAARVDGAGPGRELRRVVWPLTAPAFLRAACVVAILSLGELSAGKLVSTPNAPSYAEVIFTQMHYGVTNQLAAQCLLLLGVVAVGAGGVRFLQWVHLTRTYGS